MNIDIDAWVREEEGKLTPDSDRFYESGDPKDFPKDWFVEDGKLNLFAPIRAHLFMIKWRRERDGGRDGITTPESEEIYSNPYPVFPNDWREGARLKAWAPIRAHLKNLDFARRSIAASNRGFEDIF